MFNARDAQRIANAVMAHERRGRKQPPITYPTVIASAPAFKLGRTNSSWGKGASKTITIYSGTPLSETPVTPTETVTAYNKFADIAASRWVMLGQLDGNWYVIAAECA
jgi:hypothetical protein